MKFLILENKLYDSNNNNNYLGFTNTKNNDETNPIKSNDSF